MKIQKTKLLAFLFLLGLHFSCTDSVQPLENDQSALPSVASSSELTSNQVTDISQLIGGTDLLNRLDFQSAVIASYEGFDQLEMAFVPYLSNTNNYHVFSFSEGILSDFHYLIENSESSMSIVLPEGSVNYLISDNAIVDVEVTRENYASIGRSEGCDVVGGFLDCTNAVQDQVRDLVGNFGTLVFDVACGLWIVCRGSVVVACTAVGIAECAPVDDDPQN